MSLYNLLHGENPLADILLALVGLDRASVGRYRDCYVAMEEGKRYIAVYTRNGGGNRGHWENSYDEDEGEKCPCVGCFMAYRVRSMPFYAFDRDDDFDCTYATIFFEVPPQFDDLVAGLVADKTPGEKMGELLEKLRKGDMNDPVVKGAMAKMEPVMKKLTDFFEKGQ